MALYVSLDSDSGESSANRVRPVFRGRTFSDKSLLLCNEAINGLIEEWMWDLLFLLLELFALGGDSPFAPGYEESREAGTYQRVKKGKVVKSNLRGLPKANRRG